VILPVPSAVSQSLSEPAISAASPSAIDELQAGIGIKGMPPGDLSPRVDDTKPTYRFRVRLGRERMPVGRCAWCMMPITKAEVEPVRGKPFMLDGRPHHQECRDNRR
jgi:hypothetical protein